LTRKERALLAETHAERVRAMNDDALIELHARVRRARDWFGQLHRREVAEQVDAARARGTASVAPRRSAPSLRAERLAAARSATRPAADDAPTQAPAKTKTATPRARKRAPIERKAGAATKASSARRQAKRDAR
jgi:hypothetical protein